MEYKRQHIRKYTRRLTEWIKMTKIFDFRYVKQRVRKINYDFKKFKLLFIPNIVIASMTTSGGRSKLIMHCQISRSSVLKAFYSKKYYLEILKLDCDFRYTTLFFRFHVGVIFYCLKRLIKFFYYLNNLVFRMIELNKAVYFFIY